MPPERTTPGYEPIVDWTLEGRAHLVGARGCEIRLLLDEAFTTFADEHDLAPFGWRAVDPVGEAVEWCLDRFVHSHLDPQKLHTGSRSFRLFTEVRFWLAQRVTGEHVESMIAKARRALREEPEQIAAGAPEEAEEQGDGGALRKRNPANRTSASSLLQLPASLVERLVDSLDALLRCTCASLVGYWMEATQRLRRAWYGWIDNGDNHPDAHLTKGVRSQYAHDALFRFLCLHLGLVREPRAANAAQRAVEESLFAPCADRPPYRVEDARVLPNLSSVWPRPSTRREVVALRKQGARSLLLRLIAFALDARSDATSPALLSNLLDRPWDRALAMHALTKTILHALGLEGDRELSAALLPVCAHRAAIEAGENP